MPKNILVVDDNPLNRMVLKVIINNWVNTTSCFANNGAEGIEILKKESIDLILMDLQMPVMDGYQTTIAIRNKEAGIKNSKIPIIAVSTDEMENTQQRVLDSGMNAFMSKPVDQIALYAKVSLLLS